MPTMKLTGGWETLEKLLDDASFNKKLAHNIKRANRLNGMVAQKVIRQRLKKGMSPSNAALTIAIKGSSKPLIHTGKGLFQAITFEEVDPFTVFVGVKMSDGMYDIAKTLHDGVTIKVTDRMRKLFWLLWQASVGGVDPTKLTGRARELWDMLPGGWKPINKSTQVIVIPPRPFIREAFADSSLKAKIAENWEAAVNAALLP